MMDDEAAYFARVRRNQLIALVVIVVSVVGFVALAFGLTP